MKNTPLALLALMLVSTQTAVIWARVIDGGYLNLRPRVVYHLPATPPRLITCTETPDGYPFGLYLDGRLIYEITQGEPSISATRTKDGAYKTVCFAPTSGKAFCQTYFIPDFPDSTP